MQPQADRPNARITTSALLTTPAYRDMVTHMIELARLRAADLRRPDVQFTDGVFSYVSSGKEVGHGGMGQAYLVTRRRDGQPEQLVVAKTFRDEYMVMVAEDL